MESVALATEGIYASPSGSQVHLSQDQSEYSSCQPVMDQVLGLTPFPGAQLHQDRSHHQGLEIDLQTLGELDGLVDLPADYSLDLDEIDRWLCEDNPSVELSQQRQSDQTTGSNVSTKPLGSRQSSLELQHSDDPSNARPNASFSNHTKYRPIFPRKNIGIEGKRPSDEISFDEDDEVLSAQRIEPFAKRQCLEQLIVPTENSYHEFSQTEVQMSKLSCAAAESTRRSPQASYTASPSGPSVTRIVSPNGNQVGFSPVKLNAPFPTPSSAAAPSNLNKVSASQALPIAPNYTNSNKSASSALALPLYSAYSTAPTTPCLSADLDAAEFSRESSVDSLFEDRDDILLSERMREAVNPRFMLPIIPSKPGISISDHLKKVCQIGEEDILLTQSREAAWFVRQRPTYISPYPKPGGSLGYLPSSPSLQLRSIKASDKEVAYRLEECRRRLRTCTNERDKYRNELEAATRVDPISKKTKYQELKDEVKYLKRAVTVGQKKEKEAQNSTVHWQTEYAKLAKTYNSLFGEFTRLRDFANHMQFRLYQLEQAGSFAPVAPIHPQASGQASIAPAVQRPNTVPQNNAQPTSPSLPLAPHASAPATPVTVDLTGDDIVEVASGQSDQGQKLNADATVPTETPSGPKGLINAMRKKDYSWLANKSHLRHRFVPSLSVPPRLPSQDPTHPFTDPAAHVSQSSEQGAEKSKERENGQADKCAPNIQQSLHTAPAPASVSAGHTEDNDSVQILRTGLVDSGAAYECGARTGIDDSSETSGLREAEKEESEERGPIADEDEFARMLEVELEAS